MKIETKSYVVLVPEEGMYLYNTKTGDICEVPPVYLGVEADASDWTDITEAQKTRIEAERAAEEATETE